MLIGQAIGAIFVLVPFGAAFGFGLRALWPIFVGFLGCGIAAAPLVAWARRGRRDRRVFRRRAIFALWAYFETMLVVVCLGIAQLGLLDFGTVCVWVLPSASVLVLISVFFGWSIYGWARCRPD